MRNGPKEICKIRLSDEEIVAILDRLDAAQSDNDNKKDQRRSQRHPLRGIGIVVEIRHQGQPPVSHMVKARNVSQHGIGFLSTAAMLPGTMITVCFSNQKGNELVKKEAVIRQCRLVGGMVYAIGAEFCSFARTLAEKDLKQPVKDGD